ncbi:AraC family transcriptional regulator [Paenibacillus yonginensis]|uniref:AraC family transcriptional regulator n=1 Tax=Paenibacillus yonginensis TaxID=1462996 RepID=A0A1B1N2K0_9BACL|nr:response regulator [Paenibacillus yonginensis]ANS75636.1 AraC family transcriptional regulator [Paenibacillus yonginensis]
MIKLMIVDDEKNIRFGLKTMIEREFPDEYEMTTATQGAEALDLYRAEGADIILTDIRMPVMDGIALIERLSSEPLPQGQQGRPWVIILSGYEEFEYAKAAIRYQAVDYLLKPIRRDELFGALRKCKANLDKQSRIAEQLSATESYRQRVQSGLLLDLMLLEDLTEEEIELWSKDIDIARFTSPFTVAVLNYKYEDGSRMKKEELRQLAGHMFEAVDGELDACLLDREGRVVLVGGPHHKLAKLSALAGEKELDGLLIGVSEEGSRLEDLPKCYRQAVESLNYTFIFPKTRLIWYKELPAQRQAQVLPKEEIRKLGNILGTKQEKEIGQLLHHIFKVDQLADLDLGYLNEVSKRINEQVLDEVFRLFGEASVEVIKLYRKVGDLSNFRHFHDYFRSLQQLLFSLNEYIKEIRSAHSENGDMKEAVDYIEHNYYRPLNMAMVSNHVSLNYSYFSEAFKAYTGESFVTYLKKVRIRKAKELIGTSELKLSEISSAVGFENTRHFSRVFKELEGVSPVEYRGKLFVGSERFGSRE